jgi:hypothetical protein
MELSKPVKILLIVGAIVIAAIAVYLIIPGGEEEAPQRGVGPSAAAGEAE